MANSRIDDVPTRELGPAGLGRVRLRSLGLRPVGLRSAALHPAGLRSAALHPAGLRSAALHPVGRTREAVVRRLGGYARPDHASSLGMYARTGTCAGTAARMDTTRRRPQSGTGRLATASRASPTGCSAPPPAAHPVPSWDRHGWSGRTRRQRFVLAWRARIRGSIRLLVDQPDARPQHLALPVQAHAAVACTRC